MRVQGDSLTGQPGARRMRALVRAGAPPFFPFTQKKRRKKWASREEAAGHTVKTVLRTDEYGGDEDYSWVLLADADAAVADASGLRTCLNCCAFARVYVYTVYCTYKRLSVRVACSLRPLGAQFQFGSLNMKFS